MSKYIMLVTLIFSLVLPACNKISNAPSDDSIIAIEGVINFEVIEGYDNYPVPSEPIIKIYSETEHIYPNCNYDIITDLWQYAGGAIVYYNGICIPSIVLPALGPASSELGLPIGYGERYLQLNNGYRTDIYRVEITSSKISLYPERVSFTSLLNNPFWRFKEKSFVYLFYRGDESTYFHYDRFIDTVSSVINLAEFGYPDYGKIPFRRARHWGYPQTPPRYFIYRNDDDFAHIGEILEAYAIEYIPRYADFSIILTSWKNEEYSSRQFSR